jgi:NTP pyrophosphatase (non-canonical NTP hydrolase)
MDKIMTNNEVLAFLITNNSEEYQLTKACEELSELTTALLQYITKKGTKTTAQDVIDELGDVKIRITILEILFGIGKVNERYDFKLKKFAGYIQDRKGFSHIKMDRI